MMLVSERKPTADQQLVSDLDQLVADLDQLQRQLTGAQQEPLPTDVPQASDLISRYQVLSLSLSSNALPRCHERCASVSSGR